MNRQDTTELDIKVQDLLSQLPEPYQKALKAKDLNQKVESVADKHGLSEGGLVSLDREVTYLLLRVQTTAEFMARIEDKIGLSEEDTKNITNDITETIIRPLNEKIEKMTGSEEINMSVPTPPSQQDNDEPPKPHYGGDSDPYREPSE